jgi:transcriptional regulator with XRE-family HTH domain
LNSIGDLPSSRRFVSPQLAELGKFLMARRAAVSPTMAGLPESGKRRTPGLRREEVAMLAGVGVSWYTWIEQGRAENVSAEVLDSIAGVLKLDDSQHTYLRNLAGIEVKYPAPETVPESDSLEPFVENWLPNPAYIADRWWNVVVANDAARVLLGIRGGAYNVVREFFTSEHVRDRYPHWDEAAESMVARFRGRTAQHVDDDQMNALVGQLRAASRSFARVWDRHDVREDSCGPESLVHPDVGELHFHRATLDFTDRIALRLTVFIPEPRTGTESALRRLSRVPSASQLSLVASHG